MCLRCGRHMPRLHCTRPQLRLHRPMTLKRPLGWRPAHRSVSTISCRPVASNCTEVRVALKRWQMLLSTRRASEGLSMPWRFKAVSLPVAGCGAPVRSLFPFQEQTLASQPLDFLNHLLAIVSRLFHAEKGIQRGQSCGPS